MLTTYLIIGFIISSFTVTESKVNLSKLQAKVVFVLIQLAIALFWPIFLALVLITK